MINNPITNTNRKYEMVDDIFNNNLDKNSRKMSNKYILILILSFIALFVLSVIIKFIVSNFLTTNPKKLIIDNLNAFSAKDYIDLEGIKEVENKVKNDTYEGKIKISSQSEQLTSILKTILNTSSQINLNELKLNVLVKNNKGQDQEYIGKITYRNQELLNVNILKNKKKFAIQFPDIFNEYLEFDLDKLDNSYITSKNVKDISNILNTYENTLKYVKILDFSKEVFKDIIEKLDAKDFKTYRTSIKEDGKNIKARLVEARLDRKDIDELLLKLKEFNSITNINGKNNKLMSNIQNTQNTKQSENNMEKKDQKDKEAQKDKKNIEVVPLESLNQGKKVPKVESNGMDEGRFAARRYNSGILSMYIMENGKVKIKLNLDQIEILNILYDKKNLKLELDILDKIKLKLDNSSDDKMNYTNITHEIDLKKAEQIMSDVFNMKQLNIKDGQNNIKDFKMEEGRNNLKSNLKSGKINFSRSKNINASKFTYNIKITNDLLTINIDSDITKKDKILIPLPSPVVSITNLNKNDQITIINATILPSIQKEILNKIEKLKGLVQGR